MAYPNSNDLVSQAYHGIDEKIGAEATVEVSLRDLMKVRATLEELHRFFHQPLHYQSIEEVLEYMGGVDEPKAYKLLHTANYDLMERMLPTEVVRMVEDGCFEAPVSPFYFDQGDR